MIWKVLTWASRIFLGVIFVYAGYTKINNELGFSGAIEGYQLLPLWSVFLVAKYLPWVEVGLGVMILTGWKLRYFATGGAGLLGTFILAMAVTYARGIEADCGCFGLGEKISPFTLARDTLMMLPAVFLVFRTWRQGGTETPPPQPPAEQAA